jgi:hypothetical protein
VQFCFQPEIEISILHFFLIENAGILLLSKHPRAQLAAWKNGGMRDAMVTKGMHFRKALLSIVLVLIPISAILCSNPTQPNKEMVQNDPNTPLSGEDIIRNIRAIDHDTVIRSFDSAYIHIKSPTTLNIIANNYVFTSAMRASGMIYFFHYVQVLPGNLAYHNLYSFAPWIYNTQIIDTLRISLQEGYYRCKGNFWLETLDVKITFHSIDTIAPDGEPNDLLNEAKNASVNKTYSGYLNFFQPMDNPSGAPIFADLKDCFTFASDSGKGYQLEIRSRNCSSQPQLLSITILDSYGKQTQQFNTSSQNDELVIKASTSRTYLQFESNGQGTEYFFTILSAPH